MTHWDAAVEAGARASFAEHNNGESLDILRPPDRKAWKHEAEVALTAALPAIRRMLAEELRAASVTTSSRGNTFGAGWQSAADHLTRKEVMG